MRYRPHRGSLNESMNDAVELTDRAALLAHIRKSFEDFGPVFFDQDLKITPYHGDDNRIGWKDIHLVTIDGYGVVGFCEGNPS